jgi:hypothetical protein
MQILNQQLWVDLGGSVFPPLPGRPELRQTLARQKEATVLPSTWGVPSSPLWAWLSTTACPGELGRQSWDSVQTR